jgi:hypothetical protein
MKIGRLDVIFIFFKRFQNFLKGLQTTSDAIYEYSFSVANAQMMSATVNADLMRYMVNMLSTVRPRY